MTRLSRCLVKNFSETDFQIAIIYTQCLIRCQSNRFVIRFLSNFLKALPSWLHEEILVKLFEMMYKAMLAVADRKEPLYYELTKSKCKKIREKNFEGVVKKWAKNEKEKVLYEKEIRKLFFVDLREEKEND